MGLKPESRKRSGFGGDGGEEKLGDPEDEEGPKRRRRTSVCRCAVEGERETGGMRHAHSMIFKVIMQQLIAHDRNDPTVAAAFPSFLASVILFFFRKFRKSGLWRIFLD